MPLSYFNTIADGIRTTAKGMRITLRHMWAARKRRLPGDVRHSTFFDQAEGMVTIQYPFETIPIPDNGRYRLHNEMDDCIVCDKCAKICPVDCIDIEPIRAVEEVGKASDGSPIRLYAAKFDIDMAKCCYCGLCTTVCPTECLTMTKTFDYSELDVRDMVYEYGNLSAEEAEEKKRLLEQFQKEKEALKTAAKAASPAGGTTPVPAAPRPAFRPGMKPQTAPVTPAEKAEEPTGAESKPKPAFRPGMKPKAAPTSPAEKAEEPTGEESKPKPAFRPGMKPQTAPNTPPEVHAEEKDTKVPFKPTMKPRTEPEDTPSENTAGKARPAFKPSMKPKAPQEQDAANPTDPSEAEPKPKLPFKPTMKPRAATSPEPDTSGKEPDIPAEKPKPAFRPTMKPPPPKDS